MCSVCSPFEGSAVETVQSVAKKYKTGDISAAKQEFMRETSISKAPMWVVLAMKSRISFLIQNKPCKCGKRGTSK